VGGVREMQFAQRACGRPTVAAIADPRQVCLKVDSFFCRRGVRLVTLKEVWRATHGREKEEPGARN
jgi:hypothetical protein